MVFVFLFRGIRHELGLGLSVVGLLLVLNFGANFIYGLKNINIEPINRQITNIKKERDLYENMGAKFVIKDNEGFDKCVREYNDRLALLEEKLKVEREEGFRVQRRALFYGYFTD